MATDNLSNSKTIVYSFTNPAVSTNSLFTPVSLNAFVVYRMEWAGGGQLTISFSDTNQNSRVFENISTAFEFFLTFSPQYMTVYNISATGQTLVYFYEIANSLVSVPVGAVPNITTITASGTYNISGAAQVITVGAGGGAPGGTDGAGGGQVNSYIVNLPSSPYPVTIGAGGGLGAVGGNTTVVNSNIIGNGSGVAGGGYAATGQSSKIPLSLTPSFPSSATTGSGGGFQSDARDSVPRVYGGGGNGGLGAGGSGGSQYSFPVFRPPRSGGPYTQWADIGGNPGTGYGGGGGAANVNTGQQGGTGTPGVVYIIPLPGV